MSTSSFYTSSGTSQTLERSVADAADDAQKLATNPEDSQFALSNGTTGFSALHYNAKAEDEKTAAIETVRVMKLKHVDLIDAKSWQRWAEVQGVLKYTGKTSEELFEDFIKQEYLQIIRAVQTEIQKNEF